jgi:hypothetical protein
MSEEKGIFSKLFESGADALNPLNVLIRLAFFMFFGLITALPYTIRNLDSISLSGDGSFINYTLAFLSASQEGFFIGLSTLGKLMSDFFSGSLENIPLGTAIFSIFVLIFAIWTFMQPIGLIVNTFDLIKGNKAGNVVIALLGSILLVVMLSPFAYSILDGKTITSELESNTDDSFDINQTANESIESNENTVVNSINMLVEGEYI